MSEGAMMDDDLRSTVRMSALRHFVTPLANVLPHRDGYFGKRLLTFLAGATGYAHALFMTIPPKTKVLSHWHTDREAIFVCLSGHGIFLLDDMEWHVAPGDALFVPLTHIHGIANVSGGTMEMLDLALFSEREGMSSLEECRSPGHSAQWDTRQFGVARAYFPATFFGNDAIKWVGEVAVHAGMALSERDFPEGTEKVLFVLKGEAELDYLGERAPVEAGVAVHVVSGVAFTVINKGPGALRLNCSASLPGRYVEPKLFRDLQSRYPSREAN